LDRDVVRYQVLLDQLAHEVEVGLRGGWKTDLDLLVAELHQRAEHPHLALAVHRLDQRLIAVAQVHAAPTGRRGDDAGRPLPIVQPDRGEGAVFGGWIDLHVQLSRETSMHGKRHPVAPGNVTGYSSMRGGVGYLRARRSRSSRPPRREVSARGAR